MALRLIPTRMPTSSSPPPTSDVAIVVVTREGGEGGDLRLDMEGQHGGSSENGHLELRTLNSTYSRG